MVSFSNRCEFEDFKCELGPEQIIVEYDDSDWKLLSTIKEV